MTGSISSLARRLLLIAGGLTLGACEQTTSSTDDCGKSAPAENCVAREQAWLFLQGAAGAAGAAGASTSCPTPEQIAPRKLEFMNKFGFVGSDLGEVRENGESCCYKTVIYCEGRPLWVAGTLRVARLQASAWA